MSKTNIKNTIAELFIKQLEKESNLYRMIHSLLKLPAMQSRALYACGGIIRDAAITVLTGKTVSSSDFDFVCEGFTFEIFQQFVIELKNSCSMVETVTHTGKSFPVWKLKITGMQNLVDLALTRSEASFSNNHRDFHVYSSAVSVKQDSVRRDFTINSLYIRIFLDGNNNIAGELLDFHNGLNDIKNHLIRCVGTPEERFQEDPLRMLRAIRFSARFPGFSIDQITSTVIKKSARNLIPTISKERISSELYKMLCANPRQSLTELHHHNILEEILPQLLPLQDKDILRICHRLDTLMKNNSINSTWVFAALLFDLSTEELNQKMASSLTSTKMDARFFSTNSIRLIARQTKLPGIKNISRLCDDTQLLIHYHFLTNKDAILEEICKRYSNPNFLFEFYFAQRKISASNNPDFLKILKELPKTVLDFNSLLLSTGTPKGPHLYDIKLRLRQAEIKKEIETDQDARELLSKIYMEDTHLLCEHAEKLLRFHQASTSKILPANLRDEVRWLLFRKPVRLITTYQKNDLLKLIFPELTEANKTVLMTNHHFSKSFINDVLMALSILSEEISSPSVTQILSLLFLDIGMTRTQKISNNRQPTYYNHEYVGAKMTNIICCRLGIEQTITSDVCFIIRNHNFLIMNGGPNRYRKLIGTVDDGLLEDLLLIHRIDQQAKMTIKNGQRIVEGQLDHYNIIMNHREQWAQEKADLNLIRQSITSPPLLCDHDLIQSNPTWGPGVKKGAELSKLRQSLYQLQLKGLINNKKEALFAARNHIILHHLCNDPGTYINTLRSQGLLQIILPEIASLINLQQTSPYHQEDCFKHTIMVINQLPADTSLSLKLAAIFHDIGKSKSQSFDQSRDRYHFYSHEKRSLEMLEEICHRFCWSDSCFNQVKVNWLIANHMRAQLDWQALANPEKTMEKLFFKDHSSGREIPRSFRRDLLHLRKADSAGAVVSDMSIKLKKDTEFIFFQNLMSKVEQQFSIKKEQNNQILLIKKHWNGHLVQRHFSVNNSEIGQLLKYGQDYVRSCLLTRQNPVLKKIISAVEKDSGIKACKNNKHKKCMD